MKVSAFITAAALTLSSYQAAAAETPWYMEGLEVKDPDVLGYWLTVGDECPTTEAKVIKEIEGIFVRSRVRPIPDYMSAPEKFSLTIRLSCFEVNRGNGQGIGRYVYNHDVRFGRLVDSQDWVQNYNYGSAAFGDEDYLTTIVRIHVEEAVTAYIRANLSTYASVD